jgi:hypothetical protein
LKDELAALLEIRRKDFDDLFSSVEHEITCEGVPVTSIRLHFVRHDNAGKINLQKVVDTLIAYITQYCLNCERRKDLDEVERNKNFIEARKLFRSNPRSGQAGELLLYFFIEGVLGAPQVLKKMSITTNTEEERKGSDGVHLRWDEQDQVLEVIFGESKLHAKFSGAVADAFKSMSSFHSSPTKAHEVRLFTNTFSTLPEGLKGKVISYVEGEHKFLSREVHACLVGFNWKDYLCLNDERREAFVKEFKARYIAWASSEARPLLKKHIEAFEHKHLRFEFFFLPFLDVAEFRQKFTDAL